MRRRPQPNPRRGILRAILTVIVLTCLLIAAILIVSSLTAPTAKAPTPPATPGPITPVATPVATVRPAPAPSPSPTARKGLLGARAVDRPSMGLMQMSAGALSQRAAKTGMAFDAAWHGMLATFAGATSPTDALLQIRSHSRARAVTVGRGDPLVRPVWASGGRFLLFARVRAVHAYPGAEWTLVQYDAAQRRVTVLARVDAMALVPLGWRLGAATFLVARETDTSVYSTGPRGMRALTILMPQIITSAAMSPDGRYVAFAAPTNCSYCTLDVFDLQSQSVWNGPTGMNNESQILWTENGRGVVTRLGRAMAFVDPASHDIRRFEVPSGADIGWFHAMRANESDHSLRITDLETNVTYSARRYLDGG